MISIRCSAETAAQDDEQAGGGPVAFATLREIALSAPYLVMPIQDKAEACPVTISLGDEQLACVTVELARDKVDFWTFLDLTGHRGKTVTLSAENPPSGFDEIRSSDSIPGADNLYHEKYRPRFHFSSKRGRMNDANGLVYYNGQPSLSVLLLCNSHNLA